MRIKVHNGTPEHGGTGLCTTCRHSTITRGRRLEEEIVRCEAQAMGTTHITFVVTDCSGLLRRAAPDLPAAAAPGLDPASTHGQTSGRIRAGARPAAERAVPGDDGLPRRGG